MAWGAVVDGMGLVVDWATAQGMAAHGTAARNNNDQGTLYGQTKGGLLYSVLCTAVLDVIMATRAASSQFEQAQAAR